MIKINNLSKSFASQDLLDNVSLNINPKEKIGLVGRNGHGKTTIFKILIGEEQPDQGEIIIPKNYIVGHVNQHLKFSQNSIIDEGCLGLPKHQADEKWKVEKILFGLGFNTFDLDADPRTLSGGYQVRLNLAKVLAADPDLLLLDEPTNYLDIVSIRWLSSFLNQWSKELILITHDRSFMDSVITHTVGIHRKKIKKIEGATDKLYEQILKEEEIHEKTRINDEKRKKEVEQFISRFRAKARLAGLVQSRVKALEKQQNLDKLEKIKTLDFTFNYCEFTGKTLMSANHINFSYQDNRLLIDDFSITIGKHDRICVIGKNGKGKTTLLRILANDLQAKSGIIESHNQTLNGYFAQTNVSHLHNNLTIESEIMLSGCERQQARNICGAMMFEGDDALKKIQVLSGGEKSRVLLGKLLATPSNILFLDEPTNHLDMESCDALLGAIDVFPGAVIMVTHNEMFLHSIANKFIIFQSNGITVFEGSYQRFLEKIGWEDEDESKKKTNSASDLKKPVVNKKDLRKQRADIMNQKSKTLKPLENKIAKIEQTIEENEATLETLNNEMIIHSQQGNGEQISQLSKQIHSIQTTIDESYSIFEKLTNEHEEKARGYEQQLQSLDDAAAE